jgi:exodeoxyribonuclease VII large subunit
MFSKKENELESLKQSFDLSNPEKREKRGFVEITKNNQKVELDKLQKNDNVELSNTKTKLLAKIL